MLKFMWITVGILLAILAIIVLLYVLLIKKFNRLNRKIYKFKEEKNLKEENMLIIYQPSKHKTTLKIVENIKGVLDNKNYGYVIHTLTDKLENYNNYKKVIFVAPVYFGEIHLEFYKKIVMHKFNNLIIVYNGLNKESNKEDSITEKYSKNKYAKIKLHTEDIELVKEFINKEVK